MFTLKAKAIGLEISPSAKISYIIEEKPLLAKGASIMKIQRFNAKNSTEKLRISKLAKTVSILLFCRVFS